MSSFLAPSPFTNHCRNELKYPRREICRHGSSLYFENGNIVLLSLPKDNVLTAFKVHKDLLIQHSHVFEGMFSVPLPPTMEKFDNVPRLRLQDEAVDLIPFLKAIYDPKTIPSKRDFYFAHDKVESVFKLAKRYQAEKLLTCMKDMLSEIWPQNLWSWDNIVNAKDGDTEIFGEEHLMRSTLPEPCFSIHLARDYDVPEILPAAFYHLLCTLPQAFLVEDGDPRILDDSPFSRQVNVSSLSRVDLACFVRGNYAIRKFVKERYLGAISNSYQTRASCSSHACLEVLKAFAKKHKDAAYWNGDALDLLRERSIRHLNMGGICDRHAARYIRFMKESRLEFWSNLQTFFGLEEDE